MSARGLYVIDHHEDMYHSLTADYNYYQVAGFSASLVTSCSSPVFYKHSINIYT